MDIRVIKMLRNSFLLFLFIMVFGTIGLVLTGRGLLSERHLGIFVGIIVGVSLTLLLANSFYYTRGSDRHSKMLRNSFLIFLFIVVSGVSGLVLTGQGVLSDNHVGLLIKMIVGVSVALLMVNVFYFTRGNSTRLK